MRNKTVALGLGALALAGAAGIAPVGASTPAAVRLSADPIVHYYQSPSAIPGQKCLPTTHILTKSKPASKGLPNGLTLRVWDSGKVKNPRLALQGIRVVAVRIPAGAPAGASIFTGPNLSTAQTPTTVVSHRANIIAAVNGAIFNLRTTATPDGPQLINGVIQKATTSYVDTLNFDKFGRMSVGELKLVATGSVSLPMNGETLVQPLPIASLNHQALTPGINVYTNVWGPQVHPAGLTEVWVKGAVQQIGTTTQFVGAIDSIRKTKLGQQPPATTKDGISTWVLTSRVENDGLFAGYGVGMPITVSLGYQTAGRNNKVTTGIMAAMGRGGVYVAAGQNRANCNRGNDELRPRTLIGWNSKTGDQFFVTVQGKYQRWGVRWGGATVHQAADYMLSLGVDTAICLDGGGSTTMVIRTKVGGTPVHIDRSSPKDGQRPVVNVIGIVPMTPLPPNPTPTPTATPSASATPTVNPTP